MYYMLSWQWFKYSSYNRPIDLLWWLNNFILEGVLILCSLSVLLVWTQQSCSMFSLMRCHAHFMLWQPTVPWFLALPVGQLRVESGLTQAKCRAQGTHRESPSLSIITCILIHLICAACCTLVILQQLKQGLWVLLAKMREKQTCPYKGP